MKRRILSILAVGTALCSQAQEVNDSTLYGELEEFVVTAKKEIIKSDGEKLTYDLKQDDTSRGQTLLDALRKVPMVTVNGDDQISLNGNSNVRIYVNGKEDPMLTANYKTVFKSTPAESISKIEVITEPGAKYDAEGTGGIINLITGGKQTKEGYTGTATLVGSSQQFAGSLYGRMLVNKVTADANVTYANNNLQKSDQISNILLWNEKQDENYLQDTRLRQRLWYHYLSANMNMSWEPTAKDLFTMGADMTMVDANITNIRIQNSMFDKSGCLKWSTLQNMGGSLVNMGASGNASYRRLFSDDGHSITFAYRFNFGSNDIDLNYRNSTEAGDMPITLVEKNKNYDLQREHTGTIDYVKSWKEGKHTLEAGAKGIFRRNSSSTDHLIGETPETLVQSDYDSGSVCQLQDIYAAYASYTGLFGKFSTVAGVRYEHTKLGLDFMQGQMSDFQRHLNDVVPNASLTYMLGNASNLRAAYQIRINRPTADQMNPAILWITQTQGRQGNPDLESEKYHKVSLTYSNYGGVLGGNVALSYHHANNSIEDYTLYRDDLSIETWGNFGHNRSTTLSGYLNWTINSKMSASINGSVEYTDIKASREDMHNHGWSGNYSINWSYTGPWNIKYSAYGGQSTRTVKLQGWNSGWHYYGISIKRGFLKNDAFTVTLIASNFFTKYGSFKTANYTPDYRQKGTYRNRNWNLGISLTWNFGHLKEQLKRTSANLENDDKKKTENKGGIGM